MKQKHWILTFAAIIAVCLLVWLLPRGGGQTALVYQDGTLFYTLDLRQNRTLTVTGPAGKTICLPNRLTIEWAENASQIDALSGTGGLS